MNDSLFFFLFLLITKATSFVMSPKNNRKIDQFLASQNDHDINEFSRTLNTEKILKTASGNRRRARDFRTTISATEEECCALTRRFGLNALHSLEADVRISSSGFGGGARSSGLVTVLVEGTIDANLTRTCVRTNKDFVGTFECNFESVVKPTSNSFFRVEDDHALYPSESKKKQRTKSAQLNSLDDLFELQDALDASEIANEDILEDEHIYSISTGLLDIGELVAQNFWLALDPYPKLPGSKPVEISISG